MSSNNRSHRFIADSENKKACPFCSVVLRYHEGPNIWYCSECGYTELVEDEDSKANQEIASSASDPAINSSKKQNWRESSSNSIFIEPIMLPRSEETRRRHRASSREVFDKDLDYLNQKPGYVLKDSKEWTDDKKTFSSYHQPSSSSSSYNSRSRTSRRYH